MKKTIFLTAFILFVFSMAHAQKTREKTQVTHNRFSSEVDDLKLPEQIYLFNNNNKNKELKQSLDSVITYIIDDNYPYGWIAVWTHVYKYDNWGNNIERITKSWDYDNSTWDSPWKDEYEYDSDGKLIENIKYELNDGQYSIIRKENYTYNSNNLLSSEVYSLKTWNGYINDSKFDFYYNNSLKLQSYHYLTWIENQWDSTDKQEFSYNYNPYSEQSDYYRYENTQWNWIHSIINQYTYDSIGNLLEITDYRSEPEMDWELDYKTEYTYNTSNNNRDQEKYYSYNQLTDSTFYWELKSTENYSYDDSYYADNIVMPKNLIHETAYLNHKLTFIDKYAKYGGSRQYEYYYSENDFNETNNLESTDVLIVPNPTNGTFFISGEYNNSVQFELFDLTGKKVFQKTISNHEQININYLKSGIYLYTIISDEDQYQGKIILL